MIDARKLAVAVRAKRGTLNMRQAEKEAGVSAATLSRIENEMHCDLDTFAAVTKWLGVPMDYFRLPELEKAA